MISIVYRGSATSWTVFTKNVSADAKGELERYRSLIQSLMGTGQGIIAIGNMAITSHYGDIAKLAKVPAIFAETIEEGRAAAEAGLVEPRAQSDFDEKFRRASTRANLRAIVRVSALETDADGNARRAVIEHLDGVGSGARWISWTVGKRICLNGFRIELRDTKRAGLHFRIGAVIEDSPRDEQGYRTELPRFLATANIAANGILVLRPHDPIEPAAMLIDADADERQIVADAITYFYGAKDTAEIMAGRGDRHAGQLEYAVSIAA